MSSALAIVERWLDGRGSKFAKRTTTRQKNVAAEWVIELGEAGWPIDSVTLQIPAEFPDKPCRLYVDKRHFLKVPHIEQDGRVCLGIDAMVGHHRDPVGVVCEAIKTLKHALLNPSMDPDWCVDQFHKERSSYWAQACEERDRGSRCPVARRTLVDITGLTDWSRGTTIAYFSPNERRKGARMQIGRCGSAPAKELADRHGWAGGTEVGGQALFVRLPEDYRWIPTEWPKSFDELGCLVTRATNNNVVLADWVDKIPFHMRRPLSPKKRGGKSYQRANISSTLQRPVIVFLVLGSTVFGYQLFTSAWGKAPQIEPIVVERIDADWAISRDQMLPIVRQRRVRRVLLLGCGSLGSLLVKPIARSGIGRLDIVDKELFSSENVARHELGMPAHGRSKAKELAARTRAEVPGVEVQGFPEDAMEWCRRKCRPGSYDLIVECTAESVVRRFMARYRNELFGDVPIIHAWLEPLCSAGHVVLTQKDVPWPASDPADTRVNATDLSADDTRIELPGCGSGFHPYGMADVMLVAAFAAERVVSVVDDPCQVSSVWSWVRSSKFFDSLPVKTSRTPIVPHSDSASDFAAITRRLVDVLHS